MAQAGSSQALVARRYAEALFELASGAALDPVAQDLARLRTMLAESADLRRALNSPVIGRDVETKLIEALAAQAEFHPLTHKFLGLVARNRRLGALDAIAAAFLGDVATRRGQISVEVTAAKPLAPAQLSSIEATLNQSLAGQAALTVKIDPAIIGGLVIRVGSRLIDASVKSKLDRLGRILKTAA